VYTPVVCLVIGSQVEIINKDILANPITKKGPEAAANKTLAAAAARGGYSDSYAARSLANFGKWRSGSRPTM
jgi:hypothetical protein